MDINHHRELKINHKPYFVKVDHRVRDFYRTNYKELRSNTKRVYISRTYTSEYDFYNNSTTPIKTLEDLIRDIGPKEKEVNQLQKDRIFQYKGGKATGFTADNYYIQRSTSEYIYPVVDDLGSSINGMTGSDWRKIAVLCETEPVKKWEEGYTYMCIAIPEKYGKFTVGKTYKTKNIDGDVYRVVCEDDVSWDIHEDRHECFVKIKGSRVATTIPTDEKVKFRLGTLVNVDSLGGTYIVESYDYKVDTMAIHYRLKGLKVDYKEDRLTLAEDWEAKTLFSKGQKVRTRGNREYIYTVLDIHIQKSADPLKENLITYTLNGKDGEIVIHPEPMLMPCTEPDIPPIPEPDEGWSDKDWGESNIPSGWERDIPVEYKEDKRPPTGKTATVYVLNEGIQRPDSGKRTIWGSHMNYMFGKVYKDVVIKNGYAHIPRNVKTEGIWTIGQDKYVIVKPNSDDDWGQPEPVTEKEIPAELRDLGVKEEAKAMVEDFPILLEGPVGSGKTTIIMELADEYKQELVVDVMTRQTTVNMLMGYKNVNGDYISSKLRNAYEFGKIYLLEEINGGDPNVLLCLNTIENGFLSFPDKKIEAHKDFKMFATMNNITNSKDFSGRSVLDLSTRDRFHTIEVHTKYNDRFSDEVVALRDTVVEYRSKRGDTYDASPRDMRRYIHLSKKMSKENALKKTMLKGLAVPVTEAELRNMIKKSEDWK